MYSKKAFIIVFLVIFSTLLITGCLPTTPTTYTIYNDDTGASYQSIQAAITAAGSGHTIIVCPGTYEENIVFDGKNITVRSNNPLDADIVAATIIDGGGNDSVVQFIGGDTSTLAGFTIQNGDAYDGGGIFVEYSSPTIENNTITGNTARNAGGGIGLEINCDFTTITGNTITDNSAVIFGGGIDVYWSDFTTITGNTIENNQAGSYGGGIVVWVSKDTSIENNSVTGNIAGISGGGIYVNFDSNLLPDTDRPTGWGSGREDIPTGGPLVPAEGVEYTIAGNAFLGNLQGTTPAYTEGAHVYFWGYLL